jgi:S1-C subfamily serine protease
MLLTRRILLVFLIASTLISCKTEVNVYEKYHKSVVLLYHEYVYKINVNNQVWYITQDPTTKQYGWHSDLQKLQFKPQTTFGTGFFIDKEGHIATNKHVAYNWFDSFDATYRGFFEKWLTDNKVYCANQRDSTNRLITLWTNYYNTLYEYGARDSVAQTIYLLKQDLDKYSRDETYWTSLIGYMPQAKFEVYTIKMGYALNGSTINTYDDFKPCTVDKISNSDQIDLAIIRTNDGRTPTESGDFVDISKINPNSNIKVGDEVSMIGFNLGPQLAISKNGLQVQKTDGKISQQPDGDRVLYSIPALHGSSGSPIFNNEGELVAINFAGLDFTQSFNYGVLSKHLKLLSSSK